MLSIVSNTLPWLRGWTGKEKREVREVREVPVSAAPSIGNVAKVASPGGFWSSVFKGAFAIIIMGINAFFAALATQVYKLFTGRWRAGGGSEIPVITASPGGGTGGSDPSTPGGGSIDSEGGTRGTSADFLRRYRD